MKKIPHLFGKTIVAVCIVCTTGFSYYALRILSRTGHDATGLLAVIVGFFGGELLFLCLRNILKKEKSNGTDQETTGEPD